MKHAALLVSIVCLLFFVAFGQGETAEKATVSKPEKATEMVKKGAEKATEMAKYEKAGPRMAFTIDGDILFFDEKGTEIKDLKKMNRDRFINTINNNELRSVQTISVYTFGPGSECKIVIHTPYGTYCFWVDCETGQYIRPCYPGE